MTHQVQADTAAGCAYLESNRVQTQRARPQRTGDGAVVLSGAA